MDMIWIKTYENFEGNVTYSAKVKDRYIHPVDKSDMSFLHEYFTCKVNGNLVASCLILYPRISPNKFIKGEPAYSIYAGHEYLFAEKDDRFVMIFDLKAKKTGKGYGRILFDKLVEYLTSKNILKIYQDVDIDNVSAQRFYERLGFELIHKGVSKLRYQLLLKNYKK
jgi:RimJ/RimL family protein N-acetyltransferase